MSDQCRRSASISRTQCQRLFAKRVVCPARRGHSWIGVSARPRLDASVEIHRASFPAELDERNAGNLDRHVQQEIAAAQQRSQNAAVVFPRQGFLDELDAVFLGLFATSVSRCDDRDALRCNADMSQEEGQHALPDAAKTDDQNPPWEIDINLMIAHDTPALRTRNLPPPMRWVG